MLKIGLRCREKMLYPVSDGFHVDLNEPRGHRYFLVVLQPASCK